MRIPRIYQPGPLTAGQSIELDETAFTHLVRVLRLSEDAPLILFDGQGLEYPARLCNLGKKRASARIEEGRQPQRESPLQLQIGQVISRGERMDFAVQKATELGIQRMTPLFSERCEVHLNAERQKKRQHHWQQIAISACEQSLRLRVPQIDPPQSLVQWLENVDAELKLVLHHHTAEALGDLPRPKSIALLIGPEGGLTEGEVTAAISAGFRPVALGPRVMRTETAPVAAAAIMQYLWGDFG